MFLRIKKNKLECLPAGGRTHAEGFGQREIVPVQSAGPTEPAEPSQNRAESATEEQGGGLSGEVSAR